MARLVTSCVACYMAPLKLSICVSLTVSGKGVNRKNVTALVISRRRIGTEPVSARLVLCRESSDATESPKVGDAATEYSEARAADVAAAIFTIVAAGADDVLSDSLQEEPTQYPELV